MSEYKVEKNKLIKNKLLIRVKKITIVIMAIYFFLCMTVFFLDESYQVK